MNIYKIIGMVTSVGFLILSLGSPTSLAKEAEYRSIISHKDLRLTRRTSYADLKNDGFQPRPDNAPVRVDLPIDWNMDPLKDRNWQFQLSAWRNLDPILNEYVSTHNPIYLREALEVVFDWGAFQEVHRPTNMTWYDMASGIRALKLAFLIDAVKAGSLPLEDYEAQRLTKIAVQHAVKLQQPRFISKGNHGVPQVFGLFLLCRVLENDTVCRDSTNIARDAFDTIIGHGFTEEGIHKEHSPFYHYFTAKMIADSRPEQLESNSGSLIEKALSYFPWMSLPDGRLAPIGDTEGKGPILQHADDIRALEIETGKQYAIGDFTKSGYAIVRSDPSDPNTSSMLFFTGMAYDLAHKHADDLSFILYDRDQLIFSEAGKYGYNYNEWRDYVLTAAGHNTVSLLDHTITPSDVTTEGSLLSPIDQATDHFILRGTVVRPKLFTQNRTLRYSPGLWLEIEDQVTSRDKQSFVSSLHLAPDIEPTLQDTGFQAELADGSIMTAVLSGNDCVIDKIKGQKEPLLGWQTVSYLKMEPSFVVRAICTGQQRSMTWRIEFK